MPAVRVMPTGASAWLATYKSHTTKGATGGSFEHTTKGCFASDPGRDLGGAVARLADKDSDSGAHRPVWDEEAAPSAEVPNRVPLGSLAAARLHRNTGSSFSQNPY